MSDSTKEPSDYDDMSAQHEPGAKNDQGKVDMSLLGFIPNALLEICRVMDYGQTKYSRGGFLAVDDAVNRYTGAMFRHYLYESLGVKYDEGDPFYNTPKGKPFEGKIRHDAQLAVNAIFRLEITLREEMEQEQCEQYQYDIGDIEQQYHLLYEYPYGKIGLKK